MKSEFIGFGHYAPDNKVSNAELENKLNLPSGWIFKRTGILTRRFATDGESLVELAEKAAEMALKNANISHSEIGLTILATSTPDHLLPPTAPLLACRLGLKNSGAIDLSGACTGFLYALAFADGFVRTQQKSVLVVAANILSRRINFNEPNTAVLFADAAGAVVLSPTTDASKGIMGLSLKSDGAGYDLMGIPAGGSRQPFSPETPLESYKMQLRDGQAIFTKAIEMMVDCANDAMNTAGLTASCIHRLVPHQANTRIFEMVAKKLEIPSEKIISTIAEYGNASAATIPLSLSLGAVLNPFKSGEKILLTAAGAGLTGGAMVIGI